MKTVNAGLAALAALALASCSGAPAETLKSLEASCKIIDKASAEVCACQSAVLGDNMEPQRLEIYAYYRAEWAKNDTAYNSVELGSKAAEAKFQITEKEMNLISNEAALKYRKDIKACEAG